MKEKERGQNKMMITIQEAMQISGLPYYAVRKLCLDGKVVFVRSGKKIYLNRESFENFLKGNCS